METGFDFDLLRQLFARKPELVLSFAEFAICSLCDFAVLTLREVSRLPQTALNLSTHFRCGLQQQQQQQDNERQQPFTLLARRLSKAVGTSRIKRVTG